MPPSPHRHGPEIFDAAHRLRLEAAAAQVVGALDEAEVPSILLKGVSISRWLYPEGGRTFSDCDLLIREADWGKAGSVLARLGFEPHIDEHAMPGWWREHAAEWLRSLDGVEVDLHRTLPGVGVGTDALWATLAAHTQPIVVGGSTARTLTIPGRAFHLALHMAQHGKGEWSWKLDELDRAVQQEDETVWREAAELAAQLDATAAFASGLALVPGGAELAARVGANGPVRVDVALRAANAPPVALGIDQLANAAGIRQRLSILRHKVLPPATFVRAWFPRAKRGRAWLVIGYLWRPFWLLRRAPAGLRAWRHARTKARSPRAG